MNLKLFSCLVTPLLSLSTLQIAYALEDKSPLTFDIWRGDAQHAVHTKQRQRRSSSGFVNATLVNGQEVQYYANVSIGTPAQKFTLAVDSDSADAWVNVASSTLCRGTTTCLGGTFNPNTSSTYAYINSDFSLTYADGSGASGDYANDTIEIGGTTISGLQFGIGYNSTSDYGILGLGYIGLEQYANPENTVEYANLPVLMYNMGLIDCISWSLWLGKADSTTSQLALGGVDTGKFFGTLETQQILMDNLQYDLVSIDLQGVQLTLGDNTTIPLEDGLLEVSPDSGTTGILLPNNITNAIYAHIGATYDDSEGVAFVDCAKVDNATTLDFIFGSTTIAISVKDLILPNLGGPTTGNMSCPLDIFPSDSLGTSIIGIAFLRQVYIVYDFSHNQVSLAKANLHSTTNNVTAIGPNGVTGLSGVIANSPTTTNSTTTNPTAAASHGLSTGAKAGTGVGVALGVLILFAIATFFAIRRRRQSREATKKEPLSPNLPMPGDGYIKPELEASPGYRPSELENSTAIAVPPAELEAPLAVHELSPTGLQELSSGQPVGSELGSDRPVSIGRQQVPRRKPLPSSTESTRDTTSLPD